MMWTFYRREREDAEGFAERFYREPACRQAGARWRVVFASQKKNETLMTRIRRMNADFFTSGEGENVEGFGERFYLNVARAQGYPADFICDLATLRDYISIKRERIDFCRKN